MKILLLEIQRTVGGKNALIDALLPGFIYGIGYLFLKLNVALIVTAFVAALLLFYRYKQGKSLKYVFLGAAGVSISLVDAIFSGSGNGYFLSAIATDVLILLAAILLLIIKIPLVGLASHLVRDWPLGWFQHEQVYPAYREVALLWIVFFTLRIIIFTAAYYNTFAVSLIVNTIFGIPAMVTLLIVSYIYGHKRLLQLNGPSVIEFNGGSLPTMARTKGWFLKKRHPTNLTPVRKKPTYLHSDSKPDQRQHFPQSSDHGKPAVVHLYTLVVPLQSFP